MFHALTFVRKTFERMLQFALNINIQYYKKILVNKVRNDVFKYLCQIFVVDN